MAISLLKSGTGSMGSSIRPSSSEFTSGTPMVKLFAPKEKLPSDLVNKSSQSFCWLIEADRETYERISKATDQREITDTPIIVYTSPPRSIGKFSSGHPVRWIHPWTHSRQSRQQPESNRQPHPTSFTTNRKSSTFKQFKRICRLWLWRQKNFID